MDYKKNVCFINKKTKFVSFDKLENYILLPSNFLNHLEELCFALTSATLFMFLLEHGNIVNI